jgi:hypothetical protein
MDYVAGERDKEHITRKEFQKFHSIHVTVTKASQNKQAFALQYPSAQCYQLFSLFEGNRAMLPNVFSVQGQKLPYHPESHGFFVLRLDEVSEARTIY